MNQPNLCANCISIVGSSPKNESSQNGDVYVKSICDLCFGCTEEYVPTTILMDEIRERLKEESYKVDSFFLTVQLPVNCLLRLSILQLIETEKTKSKAEFKHTLFESSTRQFLSNKVEGRVSDLLKLPCVPVEGQLEIKIIIECNDSINSHDLHWLHANRLITNDHLRTNKLSRVQFDQIQRRLNYKGASNYEWQTSSKINLNVVVELKSTPIYIAGRYCKFSRNLHQTPWKVETKCSVTSVEEKMCSPLKDECQADSYIFTASGREDVDVRMLGNGRPFLITVNNPRIRTLPSLPQDKDISINGWCLVDGQHAKLLKQGETEKHKVYRALCYSKYPITVDREALKKKIAEIGDVEISQNTPLRVLHRRGVCKRKRVISNLKIDFPSSDFHYMTVFMRTEAGTYVKEFVSGDFGRTTPSLWELSAINKPIAILDLDVMSVELDWPPKM